MAFKFKKKNNNNNNKNFRTLLSRLSFLFFSKEYTKRTRLKTQDGLKNNFFSLLNEVKLYNLYLNSGVKEISLYLEKNEGIFCWHLFLHKKMKLSLIISIILTLIEKRKIELKKLFNRSF